MAEVESPFKFEIEQSSSLSESEQKRRMHKCLRCSHSPTCSSRTHAALPFPSFVFSVPRELVAGARARRKARTRFFPSVRCKLPSAFYTSWNRIWAKSAKILPHLSAPARSGSRSRPPSLPPSLPSQHITPTPFPKSRMSEGRARQQRQRARESQRKSKRQPIPGSPLPHSF